MNQIKQFYTLVCCENQKIWSQKKYWFLFLIAIAAVSGGVALSLIPENVIRFTMANYPYTVLSTMNYFFVPLAVFMLSSDLIANEFATNEIKVFMIKPIARHKLLLAKVAAINSYIGILLLTALTVSTISSLFMAGMASVSVINIIAAYAVGFIPALTLTAAAVMISVLSKSATASFALSLIVYSGSMVLGIAFSAISPLLFTSYMGIGNMVIGSVIPMTSLLTGLLLLIGYGIIFLSAGSYCFSVKEL